MCSPFLPYLPYHVFILKMVATATPVMRIVEKSARSPQQRLQQLPKVLRQQSPKNPLQQVSKVLHPSRESSPLQFRMIVGMPWFFS